MSFSRPAGVVEDETSVSDESSKALMGNSRYLPGIGRFLIVVTFIEDAVRIMTQWGDQLQYLRDYRHSTYIQP